MATNVTIFVFIESDRVIATFSAGQQLVDAYGQLVAKRRIPESVAGFTN